MGIKHFFSWFRKHDILKKSIGKCPASIDHLLIDMNGVIHEAAQNVYKYGKYAPKKPTILLPTRRVKSGRPGSRATSIARPRPPVQDLYKCIKAEVNRLVSIANPTKTVYLAIDGVAPKSKQNQQRQRRFRAAKEREGKDVGAFDSTCITAGTDFMWEMSQNLFPTDWLSVAVEVIVSDDSIPGEGEHKLIDWIRKSDDVAGTYCVAGMDADLILLCALLDKHHVYIMRETEKRDYDFIDVNRVRQDLPVRADDLVVWSCFIGNDFLPPIPSLEIKESEPQDGALDFFFKECKTHLVSRKTGFLNIREITRLLALVEKREQGIMEARHKDEGEDVDEYTRRFPNPMWDGDIVSYRKSYHEKKLDGTNKNRLVYAFMKTVHWVYLYYARGIKSWDWFYPYNYTLHADDIVQYMPQITSFGFGKRTQPSHPHEQLLRVIPPLSKYLIPSYLTEEMDRLSREATTFKIDRAGKRQEWEAITIVDFVIPKINHFRN